MRGENDDDEARREVLDESWFASLLEAAAAKKPISAAIATAKVRLHAFNEEAVSSQSGYGEILLLGCVKSTTCLSIIHHACEKRL